MSIKKSQDARFQLQIWSKLLEGRIALQKVVLASRGLEKVSGKLGERQEPDESSVREIKKLLSCLIRLRDTYRDKSQFCLNSETKVLVDEAKIDVSDELLNKKHVDYNRVREDIIEKWCEKTKIGNIPKKGYAALELPTLQLIKNSLRDKERLLKRTQLDRTSHIDNDFSVETFNDDDFYHQLLKEIISKDESRKWVELQRTRYKTKKKADTKATKGRKIKKDLIPKLVNFMAPITPVNEQDKEHMPEQIRDELIKSIFGGSVSRMYIQTR